MNEKQIKTVSLIGKVAGVATTLASYGEMLPPKYALVGVVVAIIASAAKDAAMKLGDLWDDGKINDSYKP